MVPIKMKFKTWWFSADNYRNIYLLQFGVRLIDMKGYIQQLF